MLHYAPNKKGEFGSAVRGNLWLQKEMYLLSNDVEELRNLRFDEHRLGPYSSTVESIQIQHLHSETIRQHLREGPIRLTSKGMKLVENIWKKSSESNKKVVTRIKQLLNDMTKWELISFIYSSFPTTTKNSDVVEDFHKERKDAAAKLFKRNKVSLERSANIAGISLDEFVLFLKAKKIPIIISEDSKFDQELSYLEHSS